MAHALPALFVLLAWWSSTALVIVLDGLPRRTFRFSLLAASLLTVAALYALAVTSELASDLGAYVAFTSALMVWGWHELTFLMGLVTGPRKEPCPPGATGWLRFRCAAAAMIHHELALFATLLAILALTWGAPNQVGTGTFLVMWVMRLSAKMNVFLGVRNLSEEFIPEHLHYLRTYFRRAPLNPLMPFSLVVSSAVVVWLAGHAMSAEASAFAVVGTTLVATILALAVLEHIFLAVPLPDAVLWRWALRKTEKSAP